MVQAKVRADCIGTGDDEDDLILVVVTCVAVATIEPSALSTTSEISSLSYASSSTFNIEGAMLLLMMVVVVDDSAVL